MMDPTTTTSTMNDADVLPQDTNDAVVLMEHENDFATRYLQAVRDWRHAFAESEMKKPLVPDYSMSVGPSGVSTDLR